MLFIDVRNSERKKEESKQADKQTKVLVSSFPVAGITSLCFHYLQAPPYSH